MRNVFWFKGVPNYGDILTPFILGNLGVAYRYVPAQFCDTIMIGSIARLAEKGITVLGSGFIRKTDEVSKDANWKWVRGPLSRKMVLDAGGECPELYGDAALILPDLVSASNKVHDVGYCPHGVDFDLFPEDALKIRLYSRDVLNTTKQITSCRKIISSSLHGIIVAHAYGIPAAYVKVSDRLTGDGMKFHDHYESVGLKLIESTLENPVFQVPTQIQTDHITRMIKEAK